ncbi:hypothetical protein J6590_037946 [Homalodisca vitripennis]|nr:hypothetical protein J6590_037946 [Homalodisca vitripennis]
MSPLVRAYSVRRGGGSISISRAGAGGPKAEFSLSAYKALINVRTASGSVLVVVVVGGGGIINKPQVLPV